MTSVLPMPAVETKTSYSVEDYLALPESPYQTELIDGEIVVVPAIERHQEIAANTFIWLARHLSTGTLRFAPTAVYLDENRFLEPDIFWAAPDGKCRLTENGKWWQGAPDLVVEILAEATGKRDRGVKFETYEAHGVREYWIIDGAENFIEAYQHDGTRLLRLGLFEPEQSFSSPLLALPVPVAALLGDAK